MSYDYYSSSEGYDHYANDDDKSDGDEDYLVDCPHCPNQVKRSNYLTHINKVHTCKICGHQMSKTALKGHKDRMHMERCLTCGLKMLTTQMKQHILSHYKQCQYCKSSVHEKEFEKHIKDCPWNSTLGMIRLDKLTDEEFNAMVEANRIYSKDGLLFKEL